VDNQQRAIRQAYPFPFSDTNRVLVVRGAWCWWCVVLGSAWCWWCVVLGSAWCWWCVVLGSAWCWVVRSRRRGPVSDPGRASLLSCSHIYAQFVICRVYMIFSFAMQEL
jgi:hypothetical protein